jgi:hypothetical protein
LVSELGKEIGKGEWQDLPKHGAGNGIGEDIYLYFEVF